MFLKLTILLLAEFPVGVGIAWDSPARITRGGWHSVTGTAMQGKMKFPLMPLTKNHKEEQIRLN